jgi:hypothetical protein
VWWSASGDAVVHGVVAIVVVRHRTAPARLIPPPIPKATTTLTTVTMVATTLTTVTMVATATTPST